LQAKVRREYREELEGKDRDTEQGKMLITLNVEKMRLMSWRMKAWGEGNAKCYITLGCPYWQCLWDKGRGSEEDGMNGLGMDRLDAQVNDPKIVSKLDTIPG
jgi:hypothetical protein